MSETSVPDIRPKPPETKREAIIYVPGLFESGVEQSADRVARRLAAALNAEACDPQLRVTVTAGVERSLDDDKVRLVSVATRDSARAEDRVLFDLYKLDYAESFRRESRRWPPLVHAVMVGLLVAFNIWPIVRSLFARSQSIGHRLQALWGVVLLLVMLLYVAGIGYASYDTLMLAEQARQRPEAAQTAPPGTPAAAGAENAPKAGAAATAAGVPVRARSKFALYVDALILGLTALGLVTRTGLKEVIVKIGVEAAGALGYVAYGWRDGVMRGSVETLIDKVQEWGEDDGIDYTKLHVISYSFGAVITLDAIFPRDSRPSRRCEEIDTLITIACPFDFIRGYWPRYFTGRAAGSKRPQWLNIYRKDDVLASNFMDGEGTSMKPAGIQVTGGEMVGPESLRSGPEEAALGLGGLVLGGFAAHTRYWSAGEPNAHSAFNDGVRCIFAARAPIAEEQESARGTV